ncbi:MAG: hypothetical protein ACLTV1_13505 [Christensenellales bacterium]
MKRIFCALLAAAMLLLPCMALADVILDRRTAFTKGTATNAPIRPAGPT